MLPTINFGRDFCCLPVHFALLCLHSAFADLVPIAVCTFSKSVSVLLSCPGIVGVMWCFFAFAGWTAVIMVELKTRHIYVQEIVLLLSVPRCF